MKQIFQLAPINRQDIPIIIITASAMILLLFLILGFAWTLPVMITELSSMRPNAPLASLSDVQHTFWSSLLGIVGLSIYSLLWLYMGENFYQGREHYVDRAKIYLLWLLFWWRPIFDWMRLSKR